MSEGAIPIKKAIPIIVVTWIISLVTTLGIVYVAPSIFPFTVTTDNIADSAVITTKLANGTVTSAKVVDGTITAVDIADGSIITVKVANGAVTTNKIDDDAVTTAKIADGAIVTVKLANGAVTSAKILDGTVTAVDLANGSIITAKIANGAVTTDKIADGNVTNIKLAPYAIPFNSTHLTSNPSTTDTTWEDMPYTSVNITLTRNSTLIIMFSSEARNPSNTSRILVRALVNGTTVNPTYVYFTPRDATEYGVYSFNFYRPNVTNGTYPINMQWRVDGDTGYVYYRTLTVIALPE